MQIIDFSRDLIPQAHRLIRQNYEEERAVVALLPEEAEIPSLERLAENGLGAAAVEHGKLLGFLGAYGPWKPAFCTPDTAGVFSPLHAHAVQRENRVRIWRRLLQAAQAKWAAAGAASHAIVLHAHDEAAKEALFLYGFGVRCMDMIRDMSDIAVDNRWACCELPRERHGEVTPLRRALAEHLAQSPCFMRDEARWLEKWLAEKERAQVRVFAAECGGRVIAYIEAADDGENYVTEAHGMRNICGAYCLPEYRGTGAAQAVLAKMIADFRNEGVTRLGVDCESFNPTALGFWSKYFEAYTYSVVRRIDENAIR